MKIKKYDFLAPYAVIVPHHLSVRSSGEMSKNVIRIKICHIH